MRNPPYVTGSYYHLYNRGVEKRKTFLDKFDYLRFLETINFYRNTPVPMKLSDFRRGVIKWAKIKQQKEMIKIYCYCLMPNHIHLLVQQLLDNGVTDFMKKTFNSYTKYFNTKYDRIGSLFQGPFKAKLIESDEYLLQLSKYIHKNPQDLEFPHGVWEANKYPYSSYGSYISEEPLPFCDTSLILSYFSRTNPNLSYKAFVEETDLDEPSLSGLYIDPS